jgi:hypothetical protein
MVGALSLLSLFLLGGAPPRAALPKEKPMAAPTRVELTEGVPKTADGLMITLDSALYAHLSGGRNSALVQLTVKRGDEVKKLGLDRLWPGDPKFFPVFGVKLAIDYVDPYHQPSTAAIFIQPE